MPKFLLHALGHRALNPHTLRLSFVKGLCVGVCAKKLFDERSTYSRERMEPNVNVPDEAGPRLAQFLTTYSSNSYTSPQQIFPSLEVKLPTWSINISSYLGQDILSVDHANFDFMDEFIQDVKRNKVDPQHSEDLMSKLGVFDQAISSDDDCFTKK
ncbi:9104_t:CDS:2, partial [Dentiscutata erythropus]